MRMSNQYQLPGSALEVSDRAAMATRFVIPVVVNGRVYFGARGEVEVYGLLR